MSRAINNFKLFFDFLVVNNIRYAILGRTNSLQELIEGDIDLAISENDFKRIEQLIDGFCNETNIGFIQNIQHEITSKYVVLCDKSDHSIICPDICSHYIRDKRLFISSNELLQNTRPILVDAFKINVLEPEYEFLYYLLKKIDKLKLNELEFIHLREQFETGSEEAIRKLLRRYFNTPTVDGIIDTFKNSNVEYLKKRLPLYRKELHKKARIKLKTIVADTLLKAKRIIYNTGLSIAIMGPDGCGKSTVIDSLSKNMSKAFRATDYYHLKPIKTKSTAVVVDPQGQKPYSFFKSIVKLVYLIFQYNIGFLRVRKQLIKSTFVVFDRYLEDLLIDKLRFRYGAPRVFAKLALLVIPKPKLYLILDASGEIIYNRKQELSIKEINRQRNKYRQLFEGRYNSFIVDASQDEKAVISDVENIVLDYLELRQKNRA